MDRIIAILFLIVIATTAAAQEDEGRIDSLRRELSAATDNRRKAHLCLEISDESYSPDTVIKYSQMAVQLTDVIDLVDMAHAFSSMGWGYFIKRDFAMSLDKYQKSAALYDRLKKPDESSMIYINIAACHRYTNNYKEMWENLYCGLDKACQACDTPNICYAYSEIADVYQNQKMGTMAQETLLKSLELAKQSGDYAEMGVIAKQFGSIVSPEAIDIESVKSALNWAMEAEGYFSKAAPLDHYYEAMRYNNYAEIIYCYLALAKFYYDDRYIDSTRHYVALYDNYANNISTVADDRITDLHIHARQLIYEQKYHRAIKLLQQCVEISQEENSNYLANNTYDLFSEAYEKMGDYKKALFYLNKYSETEQLHAGADAVMQTVAYNVRHKIDQERRKAEVEMEWERKRQDELERSKQRTFAAIIAISFAVVSIVAIMFVSWLATRRAIKIIARHNAQILKQQLMIDGQKRELQETSEKIMQSMSYARRIQMAATSSQEEISAAFPDNLVIYRPQEIVSGDWYLVRQTEHEKYLAVGGSSEHGVPGAMASMLVVDSIKEAAGKIPAGYKASPSEILAQVEHKVRSSIGEGIEISISFCIISDDHTMRFAALNNDAILVRGDSTETLIPKKREYIEIQLIEGDYLFLYSNNTRRLMSSNGNAPDIICKTLATHHADGQQVAIDAITGGHPQTGDITIVGMGM